MMVCSCININELDIHISERWAHSHCIYYKIGWLVYKYIALRLTRVANSNEYKEKRKTSLIFILFFPSLSLKGYTISCRKGEWWWRDCPQSLRVSTLLAWKLHQKAGIVRFGLGSDPEGITGQVSGVKRPSPLHWRLWIIYYWWVTLWTEPEPAFSGRGEACWGNSPRPQREPCWLSNHLSLRCANWQLREIVTTREKDPD